MNHPFEEGADRDRRRTNAVEALYATGHDLLGRGRFSNAACMFRVLLACAPHDERGWLALGGCHEGLGQRDLALQLYAAGRALSRGGGRCDLARSRLFRAMGKLDEAEEAMGRAWRRAEAVDDHALMTLLSSERRPS